MAKGTAVFGSLGAFALGTTNDGQIIGFDNDPIKNLVFWGDVNAVPTTGSISGNTNLARNMDAADVATVSSGTETLIATSGGEDDAAPIHVWRKNGPTSATQVTLVGGAAGNLGCKAGATISDDGQWLIGCGAVSSPHNGIHVFRNGTGGALASYNWTYQGNVDTEVAYADVAVDATNDVGFGLKVSSTTVPGITLFRLSTLVTISFTPINIASAGFATVGVSRGGIDVDKTKKRIYFELRAPTDGSATAFFGRYDYSLQLTAASDWQLYQ
ncbi:MAG: hypothetical protein K1X53_13445 [Candidatus Sumerlaeaceae bacterium]|nr:hypothetical protein [Candidatus Sumerlaeaceae bacterium]